MVSLRYAPMPATAGVVPATPRTHILVVDDDRSTQVAFDAMLEGLHVALTVVPSGAEALAALLRGEFAALLLDVGVAGTEHLGAILALARARHVPIIFMAADDQPAGRIQGGYRLGAADYLMKPIIREALRAKVMVFAELHRRASRLRLQADRMREIERIGHLRWLECSRRAWEVDKLRDQMQRQLQANADLTATDARKDEFIALLAHEVRNPLAALVTGIEIMRRKVGDDPVLHRVGESMGRRIRHLTRLVDDLLDVSRLTHGKVELARRHDELGRIVELAVEAVQTTLVPTGHLLTATAPGVRVPVFVDEVRMTQVVSNLLSNAARYSDPGSEITVRWGIDGESAFVVVGDRGRGIPAELIERIFDRFVQAGGSDNGLGLGLTLVRHLVELHGGEVHAESAGVGHGSEFVVRLPLDTTATVEERPGTARPAGAGMRALRIVVVEDDDDLRAGLRDLLEGWGHEVQVAWDGLQGLELISETIPDVALLDIGLPNLDGFGVARRLRERLGERTPALVALSGFGQDDARTRGVEAGFDVQLTKPPALEDLAGVLSDLPGPRDP